MQLIKIHIVCLKIITGHLCRIQNTQMSDCICHKLTETFFVVVVLRPKIVQGSFQKNEVFQRTNVYICISATADACEKHVPPSSTSEMAPGRGTQMLSAHAEVQGARATGKPFPGCSTTLSTSKTFGVPSVPSPLSHRME